MITATTVTTYAGTVAGDDLPDQAALVVDHELDGAGEGPAHRTGNYVVRVAFLVGGERVHVSQTIDAATAATLFGAIFTAGKATLAAQLGL